MMIMTMKRRLCFVLFLLVLPTTLGSLSARRAKKKTKRGNAKTKKAKSASSSLKGPMELYLEFKERILANDDRPNLGDCGSTPCGDVCIQNDAFGICDGSAVCRTESEEWMDGTWVSCTDDQEDNNDRRQLFTDIPEDAQTFFDFCAQVDDGAITDSEATRSKILEGLIVYCDDKFPDPPSSAPFQQEQEVYRQQTECSYALQFALWYDQDNILARIQQLCANDNICPDTAVCECASPNNPDNNAIWCAYEGDMRGIPIPCVPYYNGGADKVWCGGYCVSYDRFYIADYTNLCAPELIQN